MTLDAIFDQYPDQAFLKADGYDDCVLGVAGGFDPPKLIYSVSKILDAIMAEGCDYSEAREHFDYNIGGGYVGEQTPIWCEDEAR
jgi:hypothetical protein